MLRTILTVAAVATTIGILPAKAQEINFGIISTESTSNLKKGWEPFIEAMHKGTGLTIKPFFASDYAGVIEGMRFNKVQVGWFGNKSAMEAVDRASGEVFAQTVDKDGNPGYWSHILVHKDSPFQKIEDLLKCGKTLDFGIGDPNSTSGFLVPSTFIFAAKNIDPKTCFKTVRSANHEANALAVANKLVHAAANNSENLARIKITAPAKFGELRVIWTSPLIASDPLVWRKDLDPAVKTKLMNFLMTYGTKDEGEKKILAELGWAPFKKSDNSQLLPIRQMEVNKEMTKISGDAKITDDEKKTKVAELQKQFDDLGRQIAAVSAK